MGKTSQPAAGSTTGPEDPPKKDFKKIYTLAVLHMAQYFPQGFTQQALPAIFRQAGLGLDRFWLFSLPMWPRWIKFLLAIVVDNFSSERFGYRKTWIVPCTAIAAILYLSLAFIEPVVSAVGLVVTVLVVKSVFMAAQDVAVDAYCSESFTTAERPTAAAIIAFTASLGAFSGAGIVALVDGIGWSWTMVIASAFLVLAATPAIVRPEPPPPPELRARRSRGEIANPLRALRRKDSLLVMPHSFAAGWVDSFAFTMVAPFFIDNGMTLTQYGIYIPLVGIIGRGPAAFVVPKVIERFGLRTSAVIGATGFAGEGIFYASLAVKGELPPLWALITIVSMLNFVYMHYVMAIGTSRFRWVSKEQAGTDYSTQSSFYFLGVSAGTALSGFVADALGYPVFFGLAFALAATIALLYSASWSTTEKWVVARENRESGDASEVEGIGRKD